MCLQVTPERYVRHFAVVNETSADARKRKILFYYEGLQDAEGILAGTSSVMVGLARSVAVLNNNLDVHLTGDLVADVTKSGLITVLPLPPENRRCDFLKGYETVVFATHIHAFKESPKAYGQRWLLHQHCWHIDPVAYSRLQDFDIVLALSEEHRLALVAQGVPTSRIKVLPNAIDTKRFCPADQQRNNHSIMFAGALVPHKGVHILLQAFRRIRQCLPDAELHIYGSAAMWHVNDEYEIALQKQSIAGVYWHGEVPNSQMPDIYRQHGILCLPSQLESFGLVTIEAQACGCIPVVHETGGTAVTLLDGVTGFLYTSNDPDTLAETLLEAVKATEHDPGMRGNARSYVIKYFDSASQAEKLIDLLNVNTESGLSKMIIELDIIPPEIKDDEFYHLIQQLVADEELNTILEIGSSAGGGSTEAFVKGIEAKINKPKLYCMEVSSPRYEALKQRYTSYSFVHSYNVSSVPRTAFPSEKEVALFYNHIPSNLNAYPLEQVLGWLRHDLSYIASSGVPEKGIQLIKQQQNISTFDMVLIDGSEFTGSPELEQVYGAHWLLLDDITTFKNYQNYHRLKKDPNYQLYRENEQLRNGYAVFRKRDEALPIHFFTIVLNGEPYIRYHIDILKSLSFKWHWHIVEGVAELVHDTAWSVPLGGSVTEALHHDGLSKDGTSAYLDQLKKEFPHNITIYRKQDGAFWNGKREMVSAPLTNINEECLLWQLDVDELWTVKQLNEARALFKKHPERMAAYYWCWFFVGPDKIISSRNCYAENPHQEWLRTWRYLPGMVWEAHEPPQLVVVAEDGNRFDVGRIRPFLHDETERAGLVFQHFAYALESQVWFKETYYGYKGAVAGWLRLQQQQQFPLYLRNFFPWVHDDTMVNTAHCCHVDPLIQLTESAKPVVPTCKTTIVIDGVIFQLQHGRPFGISRLWQSMLTELGSLPIGCRIILLDRAGTAPDVPGIRKRTIGAYTIGNSQNEATALDALCAEERAGLFLSTYYTFTTTTPSLLMLYDMIPERFDAVGPEASNPEWRDKYHAVTHASAFAAISMSTARDLATYYPEVAMRPMTVVPCAVSEVFRSHSAEEIAAFRAASGIAKPYFLLVGRRDQHKNVGLFFRAFAKLANRADYALVMAGNTQPLEPDLREMAGDAEGYAGFFTDEALSLVYSGALALIYPSLYEGFGLPMLEAMRSGCPVITCQNSSLPEVAGSAALYVGEQNSEEMLQALQAVQQPEVREYLVKRGVQRAARFSWQDSAGRLVQLIEEVERTHD